VPRGREVDGKRTFGRTPAMIRHFNQLLGVKYPWNKYAQVVVSDFIFGGMENTTATTMYEFILLDERAALDISSDDLIAHELAHQWFGDLLTCRDWPHGWLNEGFATYSEVLWKEEADGLDEADDERRVELDSYLEEVETRYARAIVSRSFDAPIDLFDRHLYEKGALVLHELRTRLGQADFFKVVQAYVAAHAHGSVETVDLARAIEQVTGRNVDRFFDEYVYRAGHPKVSVEARFDAESKTLHLDLKQTGDVFHLTLPVRIELQGAVSEHLFEVSEKAHHFELPMPREPSMCIIDAHRDLLASLEVKKPVAWWAAELKGAGAARARTEAATALGKDGSARAVKALAAALIDEKAFWATRAACAKALAKIRSPSALTALVAAAAVKHPKARRAVLAALGEFRGEKAAVDALVSVCKKGDKSIFVEAEAARSLGKSREAKAFETLVPMLKRPSFGDTIRTGALDGLAELQDPRGWAVALAAVQYGQPAIARRSAASAVARLAEVSNRKTEAVEVLGRLLRDPAFRVRLAAIDAAQTLGDERLVGALSSVPFNDGREARAAREAVRALRSKAPAKELASVRTELDALKAEVRALKEKVERPKTKA
jgi:aminopeptidase N